MVNVSDALSFTVFQVILLGHLGPHKKRKQMEQTASYPSKKLHDHEPIGFIIDCHWQHGFLLSFAAG